MPRIQMQIPRRLLPPLSVVPTFRPVRRVCPALASSPSSPYPYKILLDCLPASVAPYERCPVCRHMRHVRQVPTHTRRGTCTRQWDVGRLNPQTGVFAGDHGCDGECNVRLDGERGEANAGERLDARARSAAQVAAAGGAGGQDEHWSRAREAGAQAAA